MPVWLTAMTVVALATAMTCTLWITLDIVRGHRQRMWIMNLVWPITALYAGPLAVLAYYRIGRARSSRHLADTAPKPFAQDVALAATHCGSGCTLGDIVAESLLPWLPFTLFGSTVLTGWVLDFAFAFALGIAFQYFTIRPMADKSPTQALLAALKADTLSLIAWQAGMYGWMAIATFGIFDDPPGRGTPVFWFMMQIAMLIGFVTAWPVNAWLLRRGIKQPM
ncbi:DUF4396 domain-containing protein [Rhodanobacter ginsengisoli]|uniref:DUF4396 domain-containing protein n=1 Tax=Rhodanobacter ginsengisoli TaxID=418646 RepID=A0ABW0QN10_9GAMM